MYYIQESEIEALALRIEEVMALHASSGCLLIVRGLPGMGKSHVGAIVASRFNGIQCESDQKFTCAGDYNFDGNRISAAHELTRQDIKQCMIQRVPFIVLSNTSTMRWEYEPYLHMATYYHYHTIVFDLYEQVRQHMLNSLPPLNQTANNVDALNEEYLKFLYENNIHQVPLPKIKEMSKRYQFQSSIIDVFPVETQGIPLEAIGEIESGVGDNVVACASRQQFVEVFDSGYYLALTINVAEDLSHNHSAIFWACILASHELMKVFGLQSGYQMIRKLVQRNLKSHSQRHNGPPSAGETEEDATNVKKLIKLNAGWAKYHITVLSPPEYKELKANDLLKPFVLQLQSLRLDDLNDQFVGLLDLVSTANTEANSNDDAFSLSLPYQQLIERIGMLQGKIVDANGSGMGSAPARLDERAALLLNSFGEDFKPLTAAESEMQEAQAIDLEPGSDALENAEKNAPVARALPSAHSNATVNGVQPLQLSSAFYLLLNKNSGVLQEIHEMRQSLLSTLSLNAAESATSIAMSEWCPHITLAFTHNDIHDNENVEKRRLQGLRGFQSIKQSVQRKRRTDALHDDDMDEEMPMNAQTDLKADAPYPFLAELALHSEVQMSFSTAFVFHVCDVKIRKGPFGDDESYRTHSVLQRLLPRGLVFLQHIRSHCIYRGIFSLNKFYGKEGMEDDGFGMSAGEVNFKLQRQMCDATHVVLMEKVNGRAGSCRFFRFGNKTFVILGTKLAHTVGLIDVDQRRILLTAEFEKPLKASAAETAIAEPSAVWESMQFDRNRLIASNALALQLSIRWESFSALCEWAGSNTINAEVLDADEMHLVVIDKLQWVTLCTTQFPDAELSARCTSSTFSTFSSATSTATAADALSPMPVKATSLLQALKAFEEYFTFVPQYQVHPLPIESDDTSSTSSTGNALTKKVTFTMDLAKSLIFQRDSEGSVIYLLAKDGRVLEMLKYKTWWYIYRRSIREIVNKLLSRFMRVEDSDKSGNVSTTKQQEESLKRMKKQYDGMKNAKKKENDEAFQSRLRKLQADIEALELTLHSPQDAINLRAPLTPIVEEICNEIRRRWPTKFAFLKNEMPDVYLEKVSLAMNLAQRFVGFMQKRLVDDETAVIAKFRTRYPVLWDEFIATEGVAVDV